MRAVKRPVTGRLIPAVMVFCSLGIFGDSLQPVWAGEVLAGDAKTEAATSGAGMPGAVSVPRPGAGGGAAIPGVSWRDGITGLSGDANGQVIAVGPNGLVLEVGDQSRRLVPRSPTGERDYLSIVDNGKGGFWLSDRLGGVSLLGVDKKLATAQTTGAEGAIFDLALLLDGSLMGVGEFGSVITLPVGGDEWLLVELPWEILLAKLQATEGDVIPHLYAICEAGDGTVYLAGEYGVVLVRQGLDWQLSRDADIHGNLFDCGVSPAGEVLAVGQLGRGSLLINGEWQDMERMSEKDLFAVAWASDRFVAVGESGLVVGLAPDSSTSWRSHELVPEGMPARWLAAVLPISEKKVLLAGSGGRLQWLALP